MRQEPCLALFRAVWWLLENSLVFLAHTLFSCLKLLFVIDVCPMCVCVSSPVSKGLFHHVIPQGRVAFLSYHTQRSCGQEGEAGTDHPCVPAELLTTLSNLLCLIPWFFMLPPPNPFPPQTCSRFAAALVCPIANIVQPYGSRRPLHLAVPSPFFLEIELTENQCRSVSRSAVPRGCWV